MATTEYDAIVVGLGAMGSAACYALQRRGRRVLGLEQFDIPHDLGSSAGGSRVIRMAYFEDPAYVPLVRRSLELWRELEMAFHERLVVTTGGLDIGAPDSAAMQGVQAGLRQHEVPFELLDAAAVRRRFPALQPPDGHAAVFQADTGFLIPERCVVAMVESAMAAGADIRGREAVRAWTAANGRVEVTTDRGRYAAARLVVAAGPWLAKVVPALARGVSVERQVQVWFRPRRPEWFDVTRMPVFIHHLEEGAYYGLPRHARPGVKICRHHGGATVDPDTVDRGPTRADEEDVRSYIRRFVPEADGPILGMKVCLYTNTPDFHFIVDVHPRHPEVIVTGGFSGHGFKFAPVVGEIAADLVVSGQSKHPIAAFRMDRLPGF